jgi:hypothetical protein
MKKKTSSKLVIGPSVTGNLMELGTRVRLKENGTKTRMTFSSMMVKRKKRCRIRKFTLDCKMFEFGSSD